MLKLRSVVFGLLLALAAPLAAFAQCSGQAPATTYCGNPTGAQALPGWKPFSGLPGAVGGSNTQLQYNNAGVLGGITGATTNGTFVTLTSPVLITPLLGVAAATSVTASGLLQAGTTLGISTDVLLNRDAANTLALRNGANAQVFNAYNTTDGTNAEFMQFGFGPNSGFFGSNVAMLTTAKTGTGTQRSIAMTAGSSGGFVWTLLNGGISFGQQGVQNYWTMPVAGHLLAGTDNTFDIGALGATRPRNVYVGTALNAPTVNGTNAFFTQVQLSSALYVGSSSGSTTVQAAATASGTLTLPAATDTLIGKATTDILTNKTYDTAGTGNVFKINGTSITSITGNTAKVATSSGVLTNGNCVSIDASGNLVDAGGACTTGGGGGTVNSGTVNQLAYYASTGTAVSGLATANSGVLVTSGGGVPSISSTLPAVTLGGTVSGGGNQLNNVIIGTSTPLAGSFTSLAYSTTLTGTTANAAAVAVGRQGATDPAILVDASTATSTTGVKIKSAAAAGGVAVSAISSGTNENLTIDAKGSGTVTLGSVSTGAIIHTTATTLSAALTYGGVTLSNSVSGTGSMALTAGTTFTGTTTVATLAATTINAFTLAGTVAGGGNQINNVIIGTATPLAGSFTSLAYSTTLTGTSANASALAIGRQGVTDPAILVDASTATSTTGIKIKSAAAAGGVAVSAISSGANENLTLDAKGSGTITLGGTSTGAITLTRATTMSAALTYGGVTLSNAVSGTGNMALTAGTTFTGTTTTATLVATTLNGNTFTTGTYTLTGVAGKTLTFNNSITLAGTDATTMTFPSVSATISRTVASGAKALATSAIGSAACSSAQTDTATGTLTTDAISATFNADPTAVTGYIPLTAGMLTIIAYPTADTVNFKVCNNTSASITPGAVTINWRVVR